MCLLRHTFMREMYIRIHIYMHRLYTYIYIHLHIYEDIQRYKCIYVYLNLFFTAGFAISWVIAIQSINGMVAFLIMIPVFLLLLLRLMVYIYVYVFIFIFQWIFISYIYIFNNIHVRFG
jgi:hypothetical protein